MEKHIHPFDWARLFLGELPYLYYLEILLRILLVFAVMMVVMRMMGKRGQRNLSPIQQVLVIALGSAAGDTLLYPSVAIFYGTLVLLGVTVMSMLMDWSARRWRPVRDYVDSRPRVLVCEGKVNEQAMSTERTNVRELYGALRKSGARSMAQVELAVLEVTGEISVFLNASKPPRDDLIAYLLEEMSDDDRKALKHWTPGEFNTE